jgi:hypothetical protein
MNDYKKNNIINMFERGEKSFILIKNIHFNKTLYIIALQY